jgi:hypothetical protein
MPNHAVKLTQASAVLHTQPKELRNLVQFGVELNYGRVD